MHIPSLRQLKRSLKIRERIDKLHDDLALIFEGMALPYVPEPDKPIRKKRKMSAAGKARIAAAQKARWAKVKGTASIDRSKTGSKKKRKDSSQMARIEAGLLGSRVPRSADVGDAVILSSPVPKRPKARKRRSVNV